MIPCPLPTCRLSALKTRSANWNPIVTALEAGNVSLDDAIGAFERGTALKAHCQARLEEARMKVEQLRLPADGSSPDSAVPFSAED